MKQYLIFGAIALGVLWAANNVDAVQKLVGQKNKYFNS